jgi:hypothetical protein
MNDTEIKLMIKFLVALESIATSLQEMVKRPLPLKTVEKRLEVAMEANAEAVEVAVATAVVLVDDDAPGDPMETKASKKTESLSPGMRVKIEADTLNDGCIGSITELRGTTWVTVKVEKGNNEKLRGDTITVSRGQCVVLKGEGNAETATEVIEEPELAPDPNVLKFDWSDMDHPGNYRIETGTYVGRTVHDVYSLGTGAQKVIHFMAFKAPASKSDRAKILQAYLALLEVTEEVAYPEE